MDILDNCIHL